MQLHEGQPCEAVQPSCVSAGCEYKALGVAVCCVGCALRYAVAGQHDLPLRASVSVLGAALFVLVLGQFTWEIAAVLGCCFTMLCDRAANTHLGLVCSIRFEVPLGRPAGALIVCACAVMCYARYVTCAGC
jgi:hypothetical protein